MFVIILYITQGSAGFTYKNYFVIVLLNVLEYFSPCLYESWSACTFIWNKEFGEENILLHKQVTFVCKLLFIVCVLGDSHWAGVIRYILWIFCRNVFKIVTL
jgi:hypothetical protein